MDKEKMKLLLLEQFKKDFKGWCFDCGIDESDKDSMQDFLLDWWADFSFEKEIGL